MFAQIFRFPNFCNSHSVNPLFTKSTPKQRDDIKAKEAYAPPLNTDNVIYNFPLLRTSFPDKKTDYFPHYFVYIAISHKCQKQ